MALTDEAAATSEFSGELEKESFDSPITSNEEHSGQYNPAGDRVPLSPVHEVAFIFVICMAQFLSRAGLSQSIAPLPIIGRSFGVTDEGQLSWYPAAFSLTVGTFILPAGRLVSRSTRPRDLLY